MICLIPKSLFYTLNTNNFSFIFSIKYTNNKQQTFIVIAILLLTNLIACSNSKDSQFENELSKVLNSSTDSAYNTRAKKMFDRMYSLEKARKKGLEYCQKLANGITKEELSRQAMAPIMELLYEGKFTTDEVVDLTTVDLSIEVAAIKAYCPSYQ